MGKINKEELKNYKKILDDIGDNKKANIYIWDHLRNYATSYTWNIYMSNSLEFNRDVMGIYNSDIISHLNYKEAFMLEPDTIALLVTLIEKLFNELGEIKAKEEIRNCRVVKLPKDMLVKKDETDDELIFYYDKGDENNA